MKNVDYAGKLEGVGTELPLTLYFATHENDAYNGEGWFSFGYEGKHEFGTWGLALGTWSHGDINGFDDAVRLGDHYVWANFFEDRLQFKGGQGGGTPITTGGWLNADWLSYTGLRLFWVDPIGIKVGLNFADPGAGGIKPVEYLSTMMFGARYDRGDDLWVALMVNNNLIYDDSETDYDGGIHDRGAVIGQGGNIGFGIGFKFLEDKRLVVAFDGIVANLGEDDNASSGAGTYKISPVETTLALKGGLNVTKEFYAELKGKYILNSGDNADDTGAAMWGQLVLEPYVSYNFTPNFKVQTSVNMDFYINSYYLAADASPAADRKLLKGQVPAYPWAYDYLSTYTCEIKPAFVFDLVNGGNIELGYWGIVSRDHIENKIYLDFGWSF
jgi:hypothetical protein